jgi:hypothetical protein
MTSSLVEQCGTGIRAFASPTCFMCGAEEIPAYAKTSATVFRPQWANGVSNVREIQNAGRDGWIRCHVREDIGKAYVNHFTHHGTGSSVGSFRWRKRHTCTSSLDIPIRRQYLPGRQVGF